MSLKDTQPAHALGHRERLRQRFLRTGEDGLADHELLELLLFGVISKISNSVANILDPDNLKIQYRIRVFVSKTLQVDPEIACFHARHSNSA